MTEQYTDEELYNYLKDLPEFENLPLPESWYKKFNIELKKPDTFKDATENNYVNKSKLSSTGYIELPTPKNYVFPELKTEPVPLEVVSKPLEEPKVEHETTITVIE